MLMVTIAMLMVIDFFIWVLLFKEVLLIAILDLQIDRLAAKPVARTGNSYLLA